MDFEKLLAQREAKQAAVEQPAPAEAPARRARQRVEGSKRAWYVQPETASRLRAYVDSQQEGGTSIDASELVDQAIAAWLDQQAA
jgi:alkylhydroperoxidase family enzyme